VWVKISCKNGSCRQLATLVSEVSCLNLLHLSIFVLVTHHCPILDHTTTPHLLLVSPKMSDPIPPSPIVCSASKHNSPHSHSHCLGNEDEELPWATGRETGTARHRQQSRDIPFAIDTQVRAVSLPSLSASADPDSASPSPDNRFPATEDANHTLPLLSPPATSPAASHSPDRIYFPHQPKSLAGIALRSFCLGITATVGVVSTAVILTRTDSSLWRLPFFLATLSIFHFLEFWTTAAYNTRVADVSSFLLTANWPGYAIAHAAATTECLLTNVFWPNRSWAPLHSGSLFCLVGLVLVVVGQTVRSVAMVQAGPSFNHMVQHQRSAAHVLVTTGIYGRLRHPSYFGFFWWALGTQLALGNVISFFAYTAVLWRFFSTRVHHEEEFLVRFFGGEYVDYRRKVGTKIPFVP